MALFGSLRSTHILMPPVFFCITRMGETQGDASIRSITPAEDNLFNSSDTSDLTAKGRRRSFWRTGMADSETLTLCMKPFTKSTVGAGASALESCMTGLEAGGFQAGEAESTLSPLIRSLSAVIKSMPISGVPVSVT